MGSWQASVDVWSESGSEGGRKSVEDELLSQVPSFEDKGVLNGAGGVVDNWLDGIEDYYTHKRTSSGKNRDTKQTSPPQNRGILKLFQQSAARDRSQSSSNSGKPAARKKPDEPRPPNSNDEGQLAIQAILNQMPLPPGSSTFLKVPKAKITTIPVTAMVSMQLVHQVYEKMKKQRKINRFVSVFGTSCVKFRRDLEKRDGLGTVVEGVRNYDDLFKEWKANDLTQQMLDALNKYIIDLFESNNAWLREKGNTVAKTIPIGDLHRIFGPATGILMPQQTALVLPFFDEVATTMKQLFTRHYDLDKVKQDAFDNFATAQNVNMESETNRNAVERENLLFEELRIVMTGIPNIRDKNAQVSETHLHAVNQVQMKMERHRTADTFAAIGAAFHYHLSYAAIHYNSKLQGDKKIKDAIKKDAEAQIGEMGPRWKHTVNVINQLSNKAKQQEAFNMAMNYRRYQYGKIVTNEFKSVIHRAALLTAEDEDTWERYRVFGSQAIRTYEDAFKKCYSSYFRY